VYLLEQSKDLACKRHYWQQLRELCKAHWAEDEVAKVRELRAAIGTAWVEAIVLAVTTGLLTMTVVYILNN
jgi:hypothetical protein